MDYKLFLSGFLTGFVNERSKIGPLPLLFVNWALVLVPGFFAYRALGDDNFVAMLGVTLALLIVVVGYSTVLSVLRVKRRKRFYKTVKHSLGLQSYSDYQKDSSRFVKVRWNFLHATRLAFNIVVSDVSMRTVKNSINDMNSMFPRPGWQWIVDLSLMKQGAFLARAVPSESEEAQQFNAVMVLSDIARDQLDYLEFPVPLRFTNERIGPKGFTCDEVRVERTGAKSVSRLSQDKLLILLNRTLPCEEGHAWVLDQSDRSVFRLYQEHRAKAKALGYMHDIVHEHMSGYNVDHPEVKFEGESFKHDQFAFTSVTVEGLKAQSLSEYKAERLYAALKTAFPLPKGQKWEASMASDVLTVVQVEESFSEQAAPSAVSPSEPLEAVSEAPQEQVVTPKRSSLSMPSMRRPGDTEITSVVPQLAVPKEEPAVSLPKKPRPPSLPRMPARPASLGDSPTRN